MRKGRSVKLDLIPDPVSLAGRSAKNYTYLELLNAISELRSRRNASRIWVGLIERLAS